MEGFGFWPFGMAFAGIWAIFYLIALVFWILMIVDCAKRKFKENNEKIVWLIVVIIGYWVGALAYYLVIRMNNPDGIYKHRGKK